MAPYLTLTNGGTTVTLSATDALLANEGYVPSAADADQDFVTESCTILLQGSTATQRATVNSINQVFSAAREFMRKKLGSASFVHFKPDSGDADAYRSLISDGRIEFDNDTLNNRWVTSGMLATLVWTRRNFWESDWLTSVEITASGSTAGEFYNINEPAAHMSGTIGTTAVTGELPARATVTITQRVADVVSYGYVLGGSWTGYTMPYSTSAFNLEAELATLTSASTASAASASNNAYATWTDLPGSTSHVLATWSVSSFTTGDSDYFHIIAKAFTTTATPGTWLWYEILDNAGTFTLASGPRTLVRARYLHDLGVAQLPPGLIYTNPQAFQVRLKAFNATTHSLDLDQLLLVPADTFRRYTPLDDTLDTSLPTRTIANGEQLVDDPYLGNVYSVRASSAQVADFQALGSELTLAPGRLMRLFVIADAPPASACTLTLSYRARRLQI